MFTRGNRTLQHFIDRLKERYGLEITRDEVVAMRNAVLAGDSILLGKPGGNAEYRVMTWNGVVIKFVWNVDGFFISAVPMRTRLKTLPRKRHPNGKRQRRREGNQVEVDG
jgi:hypothetical protein